MNEEVVRPYVYGFLGLIPERGGMDVERCKICQVFHRFRDASNNDDNSIILNGL